MDTHDADSTDEQPTTLHPTPAGWQVQDGTTLVHSFLKSSVSFSGRHPVFVTATLDDEFVSVPLDTIAALLHEAGLRDVAQEVLRFSWRGGLGDPLSPEREADDLRKPIDDEVAERLFDVKVESGTAE